MRTNSLKFYLFLSALIVIGIASFIRVSQVANYNFPFTTDQARDMLDIRNIVAGKNLTLIGPTTSINGVFLGPGYYYFNVLPFFIGGGDPAYLVYWNILWYSLAAAILLFVHRKSDSSFGFFASIFFIMSPIYFQTTKYFWNSNSMPYFVVFYFIALIFFLLSPGAKKAFLSGMLAGVCMQFQAAFGILLLPFALIMGLFKKVGFKYLLIQIGAFLITLIPQLLFEFRHQFIMSKIFIREMSGTGDILKGKLDFWETVASHKESFIQQAHGIIALPYNLDLVVLLAAVLFLALKIYQRKLSPLLTLYTQTGAGFLVFSFCFYSFYHYALKDWFVLSLSVPYLLLLSAFFASVYQHTIHNRTYRFSPAVIALLLMLVSLIYSSTDQTQFIPKNPEFRSDDKSNLRNELQAIDWVYEQTAGKGFKAYNYIPSVYDFPYQYLYWWYATPKYGYQPEIITYKDGVPEYITNNNLFLTKTKPQQDNLIALIYEDDDNTGRRQAWGGDFTQYCPVKQIQYDWGTSAEIRHPCTNEERFLIEPQLKSKKTSGQIKTIGVVCFIINNNRLLMQSKEYGAGNLKWNGILGFGSPKDKLEDIMYKSCYKNLNPDAPQPDLKKVAEIEYPDLQLNAFLFNDTSGDYNLDAFDADNTRLFDIYALPFESMWPDSKKWIPEILNGKLIKSDGKTFKEVSRF